MPVIRFCDIDTDKNGYLDANEIAEARKKGVKRELFVGMTSDDIKNNRTRNEKLSDILSGYSTDEMVFIYVDSYEMSMDCVDVKRAINIIKRRIKELENEIKLEEDNLLLKNAQLKEVNKKEEDLGCEIFDFVIDLGTAVKNLGIGVKNLGTLFQDCVIDPIKYRNETDEVKEVKLRYRSKEAYHIGRSAKRMRLWESEGEIENSMREPAYGLINSKRHLEGLKAKLAEMEDKLK